MAEASSQPDRSPRGASGRPVLCARYVSPLLDARRDGLPAAETSLDLGRSRVEVAVGPGGTVLPGGVRLGWDDAARIAGTRGGKIGEPCFEVGPDGAIEDIRYFSEETGRHYGLVATDGAPTMLVSGFQMHRTTGTDPLADTRAKIRAAAPVRGRVLDTTTGLGYTAIEAAKTATAVVTIELDPVALEVARRNPWSRALFDDPRITRRIGDSAVEIAGFPDGAFARVIHDPPVFALAGELYSGAFYAQVHRVLAPGGRLFHYVGNPNSPSGRRTTAGVTRRLREAGFARVVSAPAAFGVVAFT